MLYVIWQLLRGVLADNCLRQCGILRGSDRSSLRFHTLCNYRDLLTHDAKRYPALIAVVTKPNGELTEAHRTRLDPDGNGKATGEDLPRALYGLHAKAVRMPDDASVRGRASPALSATRRAVLESRFGGSQ